jgi:hypothetical protein
MQKFFVIKYDIKNFKSGDIVKFHANTYHEIYLVENIITGERGWLAKYDIYPITNHDNFLDWSYNKNNQLLIPSNYYIVKNEIEKVVKILDNTNEIDYIVLDIENNIEITLKKNDLIKANEL